MPKKDSLIGHQLANFRIERLLGRGGMASVYQGWDVKLHRPVAIKVIDSRFQNDPTHAQRFVKEARTIATWRHENILQVHYADDEDGLYYYVMEFIRGLTLAQLLAEYTAAGELLPHEDVIRIGRAIAEALDYAHQRGVIHRDVKPPNVMISEDGRVVLADFGLALDIAQGTLGEVFGSPHYIAPEQARDSAEAVPQSDLYSLGIILYEMLTGSLPFDDPSPMSVAIQHLTLDPPPAQEINPILSPTVESVLIKALSKSIHKRFQTGCELLDALADALQEKETPVAWSIELPPPPADIKSYRPISEATVTETVAAYMEIHPQTTALPEPPPPPPRTSHPTQPKPLVWWAAGGFVGLLILGAFFLVLRFLIPSRLTTTATKMALATPLPELISPLGESPTLSINAPDTFLPTLTLPVAITVTSVAPTKTVNLIQTTITQTETLSPDPLTDTPPSPTRSLPTVPPSDWDYFTLYYDDTGFYFHNLSGEDRHIWPIAFERLDKDGNWTNRLEGWYWMEIYNNFRAGYCMVAEILELTEHLEPPECVGKHLVIRTPTKSNAQLFWTTQKGSTQFRVLWDDEEITRCEIAAGFCEIYLP
jgi:serine/threonine protein kinase